jgi:hypothetical protein
MPSARGQKNAFRYAVAFCVVVTATSHAPGSHLARLKVVHLSSFMSRARHHVLTLLARLPRVGFQVHVSAGSVGSVRTQSQLHCTPWSWGCVSPWQPQTRPIGIDYAESRCGHAVCGQGAQRWFSIASGSYHVPHEPLSWSHHTRHVRGTSLKNSSLGHITPVMYVALPLRTPLLVTSHPSCTWHFL